MGELKAFKILFPKDRPQFVSFTGEITKFDVLNTLYNQNNYGFTNDSEKAIYLDNRQRPFRVAGFIVAKDKQEALIMLNDFKEKGINSKFINK